MKVSELIEELNRYNPEAVLSVIVHNKKEKFTITYGGGEGVTPFSCKKVSFYVDGLCDNEKKQ